MGRSREFDTEEVLLKIMRTFWHKGYFNTSIDDLMRASGLTKASLYNAFGYKKDIYISCVEKFTETFILPLKSKFTKASDKPFEVVKDFLVELFSAQDQRQAVAGCFLINTVTECHCLNDRDIFKTAHQTILSVESEIADFLFRSLNDVTEKTCKNVAHFIIMNIQGLRISAKRGYDQRSIQESINNIVIAAKTLAER